jgi:hypothetical protein
MSLPIESPACSSMLCEFVCAKKQLAIRCCSHALGSQCRVAVCSKAQWHIHCQSAWAPTLHRLNLTRLLSQFQEAISRTLIGYVTCAYAPTDP